MKNQNKVTVGKWNGPKKRKLGKYCLEVKCSDGLHRGLRLKKSQLIQLRNDIDNLTDKIPF